jgi:hypothetical protein
MLEKNKLLNLVSINDLLLLDLLAKKLVCHMGISVCEAY